MKTLLSLLRGANEIVQYPRTNSIRDFHYVARDKAYYHTRQCDRKSAKYYHYPHFSDEETETQTGHSSPKSLSKELGDSIVEYG